MLNRFWIIIALGLLTFTACFKNSFQGSLAPKQHFEKGMELFNNQEYKKAQKHLDVYIQLRQDSVFTPQAIFYVGESFFHLKKYSEAQQYYNRLKWNYPNNPLASVANEKINLCYQQQFHEAKRMFDKEDYLDARDAFKVIILSSRAGAVIDSARFYYADCYYHTKEYILAISEFQRLRQLFSESPLADDAQYKIAMCYYKLSPGYALDQEYTLQAIKEFQLFLELYPYSEYRQEGDARYLDLRMKIAKKEYKTGDLYRKMGEFEAAVISYQKVMNEYYDTSYAPEALYWQGVCYKNLEDWSAARDSFSKFVNNSKFSQHKFYSRAQTALNEMNKKLELTQSK
ncbi:outer membrane protein assembly factor BamD [candidate division KSB1 bacterium]|nr:outer membrane protein assembly factor BamD [candidate division KSB1 bacterium]